MHKTFVLLTLAGSLFLLAFPGRSQTGNLKKGLLARYLFNGTLNDGSGNGNDGLGIGNLPYVQDRFGNDCGALAFDGSSYVVVPSSRSLKSPQNELTVTTWFKLDQQAGPLQWLTICCKSDLALETPTSPQYRCQATKLTLSVNTEFTENLNQDLGYDVWQHYAMVYDGQMVKAYLNGQVYWSFPYSGQFVPNDMPLEIGRDLPGAEEFFVGSFDDLRIYNRGLSDREIQAIYADQSEQNAPKACPSPKQPPVVTIRTPATNPYQSPSANQTIEATIEYVQRKRDVTCQVNGSPVRQFSFNPKSQLFQVKSKLQPGRNLVEITAVNTDGQDQATTIINYQPPVAANPPVVTLLDPGKKTSHTQNASYEVIARIEHVRSANDVIFKVNGQSSQDFEFNPARQHFSSLIDLEIGNNIVEIVARNPAGSDDASGLIRFEPAEPTRQPPVVTLVTPVNNPHTTSESEQLISARILHVDRASDISFKVNGMDHPDFKFNPSTGSFASTIKLDEGFNLFEILARNPDGEDHALGRIRWKRPGGKVKVDNLDSLIVDVISEIEVKSDRVQLICYDHKKEDGDIVSVIINGEIVVDRRVIKNIGNGEIVRNLQLTPNAPYTVVSKAWNLGAVPPNTLTVKIDDGVMPRTITLNSEIGKSQAFRMIYNATN